MSSAPLALPNVTLPVAVPPRNALAATAEPAWVRWLLIGAAPNVEAGVNRQIQAISDHWWVQRKSN